MGERRASGRDRALHLGRPRPLFPFADFSRTVSPKPGRRSDNPWHIFTTSDGLKLYDTDEGEGAAESSASRGLTRTTADFRTMSRRIWQATA